MNRPSIRTAWDEAGDVRWTGADKARFDRAFRDWAKRTGNQTSYEIRLERGDDMFSRSHKRRRTS